MKKGISHSPIDTHKWSRPSQSRDNAGGTVKNRTIANSPVKNFDWKRKGRDNSK